MGTRTQNKMGHTFTNRMTDAIDRIPDIVHMAAAMAIGLASIAIVASFLPGDRRPAVLFVAAFPGILYLQAVGVHYEIPEGWGEVETKEQ